MNVFSGLAPASPDAMNIDPEAGGDAPSVEENASMATTATNGSTPADVKAENDTKPTAVSVAVEDSGPATNVTKIPTIRTISHFGISSEEVI